MSEDFFQLNFPGTSVITDTGESVTYSELAKLSDEVAAAIGDRALVFCLTENTLGSLLGYVGCLRHRIVPLLIDAHIDRELLERFLKLYRPDFIWAPATTAESLPGEAIFTSHGYFLLKRTDNHIFPLYEDLALLLTTSGSTGSPKLVRQSYKNIIANTASIIEYLHLDATERPITTLPMNYTYGLSIINTHLHCGATLLMTTATLMQRSFWEFFVGQQATSFGGVPYTYEMLDKLMFFRRKLPSLRTMTQAGGKILPSLHLKFAQFAAREQKNFVVMYGQCEATARMGYLPPERALDKIGAMGIAIPGGRFHLVDVDGKKITSPGITGELVYEGENVTLGYAECGADLSKGDEHHGKLVTGDMAQVDDEGFYTIVGRKKRFLKIFGNRVSLDETERLIKDHFPDVDCACGGVDDKMAIYVTVSDRCDNIQHFVAEKTHLNFSAFRMIFLPVIPKTASGKVLYTELPQ